MKILSLSDIHNDVENLIKFLEVIKENFEFDVVIAVGDFIDVNLPKGFKEEDIGRLIIESLKILEKPILAVPGNFDKKLIPLFEEYGISLHGKGRIIGDIGFYGFGGAKTPFGTPLEPSEEEISNGLEKGYQEILNSKFKVQITHVPPYLTRLDLISSGLHVGSQSVRKFIEEKQPNLAICAHIHEARGIDQIGKTKIINSGRFSEGYFGLSEIKENGEVNVKLVNVIELF